MTRKKKKTLDSILGLSKMPKRTPKEELELNLAILAHIYPKGLPKDKA